MNGRRGRQACFFSAMHSLDDSLPEANDVPASVPKMEPYKHSKKNRSWCSLHIKIVQDRGSKFSKTGSFAIILYNTMPTEALVKVVNFNRNDSETEILFDKRQTTASHRRYTHVWIYWNRR